MSEHKQEPIVELSNLSVFQRNNLVLSDISLNIHKGEFVYLIGRTGSGKSSFMRTLYADLPLIKATQQLPGSS